jgi:hypothetical protein
MMEVVRTSETSLYYNETTWRNIAEGSKSPLRIHNVVSELVTNIVSVVF